MKEYLQAAALFFSLLIPGCLLLAGLAYAVAVLTS